MERYVGRLFEYGLVKVSAQPEWVSALLIVPKNLPAMFRLTVDLRVINVATVPMYCSMPHLDRETNDMRGAGLFSGINFCSGYSQASIHVDSQPLHEFTTTLSVVQPTRTLQGGNNSAANFQMKVEPCFSELRDTLKV